MTVGKFNNKDNFLTAMYVSNLLRASSRVRLTENMRKEQSILKEWILNSDFSNKTLLELSEATAVVTGEDLGEEIREAVSNLIEGIYPRDQDDPYLDVIKHYFELK